MGLYTTFQNNWSVGTNKFLLVAEIASKLTEKSCIWTLTPLTHHIGQQFA